MNGRACAYAAIVVGLILFIAFDLRAQPVRPPPLEIRYIGLTESTSDCIGDPRTLVCAIDTYFACIVRRDADLCRRVGVIPPQETEVRYCGNLRSVTYEFESAKVLAEDDLYVPRWNPESKQTERRRAVRWSIGAGDVDVFLFIVFCRSESSPCPDEDYMYWSSAVETLRSLPRGWRFVDNPPPESDCPTGDDD